jgi:F-type H+-transporting ATPase subunit b
MPQIDQIADIYASQLFWLVVVFALLYFGIGKAIVPKIQRTVDDRDAKIRGDLAAADAARAEADAADESYNAGLAASRTKGAAAIAAAKAKAIGETEERVAHADVGIATRLQHAETILGQAREKAVSEIEAVAVDAAQQIVERVTGRPVEHGAAAEAVVAFMAKA